MKIITTHLNADFDCLASMVAAKKLYPAAKIVFSGSAEKAVNQYLQKRNTFFEISRIKDIDLDRVTDLILVDTQDPRRIGVFQSLTQKPDVKIHVYDHHSDVPFHVKADFSLIKKRGAATTIMVETLLEKNISLTSEESTLMVLGIYQDTQSLLSTSTTPEDFQATGRLVQMGADLNVVAEFIEPRLNQDQLNVFNDLIRNLESFNINGVKTTIATASVDFFVEDLAYVVQRVMNLENLSILFILVLMDRRVCLIGRSRTDEVDASEVARVFSGGGHKNAASASIRDMTLVQAREKLLGVLNEKVRPLFLVKDVMHFPVISVSRDESVRKAEKNLTLYNLNSLPVMDGDVPVGLITRQIVEKAIHHKMGMEQVSEFMIREFSVTFPDSYFKTLIPMVIEEKQKLIPVVDPEHGRLAGIVSRGDLLRVLYRNLDKGEPGQEALMANGPANRKNIKSLVKERLDRNLMVLLEAIEEIADRKDFSVYVVGGFVRDILLGIKNLDVDLVVEGNGIEFARILSGELNGRLKSHAKFGTAVIILSNGFRIDVATARMEYYKHPAALPTVKESSVKADLFRRDFTINSLAVKLNGENPFSLIDYFNGEKDLKDRVIRVLHNLSFIEDPCRIFRAIRFEQRFRFSIGKQTEAFMKSAVKKGLIDQLSGSRLLNELVLILKEEKPMNCIRRMKEFSLFGFFSPGILRDKEYLVFLERIETVISWSRMIPMTKEPELWFVYFLGLFYSLNDREFSAAVLRLRIHLRLKKRLETDREACREFSRVLNKKNSLAPNDVYDIFSQLSPEAVIFLLAISFNDRINKYATLYFTQYLESAKISLTGDDLIAMGVQPGPVFQKVFKSLRDARVNGTVTSKMDEIALVERQYLN